MAASATPALLIGPPELRNCNLSDGLSPSPSPLSPTGDDFLDMLKNGMLLNSKIRKAEEDVRLRMGLTENASATYLSSGNACLDLFFHVVPDTPPDRLIQLLQAAWKHDPLTALKLVFNLRGVRGTGKTNKEGFYTAVCWMHSAHPKTLLANVKAIAYFGYLKDLPEILFRILEGSEATEKRKAQKEIHKKKIEAAKSKSKTPRPRTTSHGRRNTGDHQQLGYFARKGAAAREAKKLGTLKPQKERIADDLAKGRVDSQQAALARKKKSLEAASRALKRYSEDPNYRALHDEVARIFALSLSHDLEALRSDKLQSISLAAKWCPSLDSSYDRSILLCENIARILFPRHSNPEYSKIEQQHYAYKVRERLRKEVLVPLRKALELPEVFMSARLWDQLPYGRVASVATMNYQDIFVKHDGRRFSAYLTDVADGQKKIAAGALLPHEIIKQALDSSALSVAEFGIQDFLALVTKLEQIAVDFAIREAERQRVTLAAKKISLETALARKKKYLEAANSGLKMFYENPQYRASHDQLARIFARSLSQDLKGLYVNKLFNISFVGNWCPPLDSSYNSSNLLRDIIARTLLPPQPDSQYSDIEHQRYRVAESGRKNVLVPLTRALQLPKVFIGVKGPDNRAASVTMTNYKDIFTKHDPRTFKTYLKIVVVAKKKIAASARVRHEIIKQAMESAIPADDRLLSVAELQWKRMVDDMTKRGKFSNSLAVCDVSGSMNGLPMEVCVALGLLVSEMSDEPWKGHIITFSQNPQLLSIKEESLVDKHKLAANMVDRGRNTDFQKVFDLILQRAAESGLPSEKMIRQLFVFSDMEFDQASTNPCETDFMAIKRKFRDAGYGEPPKLVFWNLRNSQSMPVVQEQNGAAMVSDFSKNLLRLFLENDEDTSPLRVMKKAITGKRYDDLVVVD